MRKSQRKILVVDDSEDIRMFPKLRKAEYEVVFAVMGCSLAMVDEHPDLKLIILDVKMPVMNGVQVMKFLDKIEKKCCKRGGQ